MMGKINFYTAFLLVITFLTILNINCLAGGELYNVVSLQGEPVHLRYWQITADPEPENSLQVPPDSLWRLFHNSLDKDKYAEGNWLIRTNILVDDSAGSKIFLGLFPVNFITAYEIYWDGMKIAQNGVTGIDNNHEKAGKFNFNQLLSPQLLTKGKHTLTLRISNHNDYSSWKWFYGGILIGPYDTELKRMNHTVYQGFFITGILFIPFLFNLFLYIARNRKTEHLLFSLICFIVILDSLTGLVPVFIDAPTTFIHWELYAWQIITVLFTVLLPAFFIYLFSFPKKIIAAIIVLTLTIFLFFTNLENAFDIMSLTVLIVSSTITLWALYKRRPESLIIFAGLIIAWAAYFFNLAFTGLATIMVICTTFSIARQFSQTEKAEKEAQLKSAHLENELLKKNINPHFILNTLTSINAWLRKDPQSAIKLIEELADEFRMIVQISALKQIPILQEIDLCRAHLKIMSYRRGADYRMETVGITEDECVPPMIFHTLIENGLTHGYENKMRGTFTLQRKKDDGCIRYILSDDGEFDSDESKDSTGFGLRYIRSRLEESYPDRWKIVSHKQAQGWETIIEIKDK